MSIGERPKDWKATEGYTCSWCLQALTPLDESLLDTRRALGQLDTELKALEQRAEAMQAENVRLTAENATLRGASPDALLTAVNERLREELRQAQGWKLEHLIWRNDRRRIAETLAAFYRAPLSMSSVQPVLTLAEELNPSLKVTR